MTDIEIVKMLSGNNDVSDDVVSFYLESTEEFIKAYCNVEAIPQGMRHAFLEIASLRVKANTSGSSSSIGEGIKTVGSVSDGNQSVSYVSGGAGSKSFVSEEDLVSAYGHLLDRFRRLDVNRPSCRHLGARRIRR